jgi:uncharacterized protein
MRLSLVVIFLMLNIPLVFAKSELEKTINVSGSCKQSILPDRVSVTLTIEELNKEQKASSDKATEKYNELLAKIKKMKLKDAEYETVEYSVFPHNPWENNKQVFKGFKTRMSLKVSTSELNKSGELLTVGNSLGQNAVQGPHPFVSDALFDKTYRDCLSVAMKDAFEKATMLAKSAKRKLGKVIAVHEGQGGESRPMPMLKAMRGAPEMMAMDAASAPPEIEFGKDKINVRLNVFFEMD